jgi:CheY-like chemotaxis protein
LIEAMGGTLEVESVSGTGSTFHFSIALGRGGPTENTSQSQPETTLGGQLVLVVDDNPTNRRILRRQLEGWGMGVTEAGDGDTAISIVDRGQHFDVAVIDMKMPGMSGQDLAAHLRSSPDTRHLPLILLSSHTDRPDAGTPKPVFGGSHQTGTRRSTAATACATALSPSDQCPRPSLTPRTGSRDRRDDLLRVLVVDDNAVNQLVVRRQLEKLGHHVDMVGTGREATEAVRIALATTPC